MTTSEQGERADPYWQKEGVVNVFLPRCEACRSTDPAVRNMPAGFRCDDPSGFHQAGPPAV